MKFLLNARQKMGVAGELAAFLSSRKRWWLIPVMFMLFLLGALIVLAQSSAIAPFIYTLF
jgi:hypothetical protein